MIPDKFDPVTSNFAVGDSTVELLGQRLIYRTDMYARLSNHYIVTDFMLTTCNHYLTS